LISHDFLRVISGFAQKPRLPLALLSRADTLVYQAKSAGRQQVVAGA
jgi:PleD family two-component response regulator